MGKIYDKSQTMREPHDQDDNFDLMRATSEKMALLRPIIMPEVYRPLLFLLRKRVAPILSEMIYSLYPTNTDEGENSVDQNSAKVLGEVHGWAKEVMADEGGGGARYGRILHSSKSHVTRWLIIPDANIGYVCDHIDHL